MTEQPNEVRRVLVVEDEPAIAMLLVDCLGDEGYDVRRAGDGVEALEVLEGWLPDVILLDLVLPTLDGFGFRDAQRRLPDRLARIPVIVVTASRLTHDQQARLDAAGLIRKPFDIDQLLAAVAGAAGPSTSRSTAS